MKIYTIGFTRKSAETFFTKLKSANVKRLVDVRLHNVSQLSGFAKRNDLEFFTRVICNMEYIHEPSLAPTNGMLDSYKKLAKDWYMYEREFLELMRMRRIEDTIPRQLLDGSCLLCSEEKPDYCHRRLVAEYFHDHWAGIDIEHIL